MFPSIRVLKEKYIQDYSRVEPDGLEEQGGQGFKIANHNKSELNKAL